MVGQVLQSYGVERVRVRARTHTHTTTATTTTTTQSCSYQQGLISNKLKRYITSFRKYTQPWVRGSTRTHTRTSDAVHLLQAERPAPFDTACALAAEQVPASYPDQKSTYYYLSYRMVRSRTVDTGEPTSDNRKVATDEVQKLTQRREPGPSLLLYWCPAGGGRGRSCDHET